MELSLNYDYQIDESSYISMKTPLIPVKYQIRSFADKELGYDRAVIYFQYAGRWRMRLHSDIEEMLALYRKIGAFLKKNIKEGHLEILGKNLKDFPELLEKG